MKKFSLMLLLFGSLLGSQSCGDKEVDTEAPTLQLLSTTPSGQITSVCGEQEENVFVLAGGEELSFELLLEDNSELSQYKIDIHNNFDCHGHGEVGAPSINIPDLNSTTTDWSVLEINELSGQSQTINKTLMVPENVTAGNYHFELQVLDESGNDQPKANIYSLVVTNSTDTESPILTINEPNTTSFSIAKGENLRVVGTLTDNYSLSEGGNGVLFLAYTNLSNGNNYLSNAIFPFDNTVATSYDFDFEFTIPSTLLPGDFLFTVGATDGVRNVANAVSFNVAITN